MGSRLFFYIRTLQLPSDKRAGADTIDKAGEKLKNARYRSFEDGCNWLPGLVEDGCD